MRVQPEVSSLNPTEISVGGVLQPQFNVQSVQTTVLVADGETIVIGGLIQKNDNKTENKIPWLGDLPYVGAAFRYRQQVKKKTELLVILTPHIIRSWADADRVLYEESRRMDWITGDVLKSHGTYDMEPIIPGPAPGNVDGRMPSPTGPEGAVFPMPTTPPAALVPPPNGTMPPASPPAGFVPPVGNVPPPGSVLPPPRLMPQGTQDPGPSAQQQWTVPPAGQGQNPAPAQQPWTVPPSASAHTSTEQTIAPMSGTQEEKVQWTVPASKQ